MPRIRRTIWLAATPVLDELMEAGATQRAHRLAQLRQENPALAGVIEELLARETAVEHEAFLEGSALEYAATALDPPPGTQVGTYTLEQPLGRGGMSSVWLARRSDGRFEGRVAIKLLAPALLTRGGSEWFKREGNVLARLAHPNIARLLDAGLADGGQPYLVLEYVDGVPIDRWCDSRAFDVDARVRLFLDVLAAVEHAHDKLILHRDLKPGNILVTAGGEVKLLDFGTAKMLDDREGAGTKERAPRPDSAFTPQYAAPEQIDGGAVTNATDIYSLGVLLFELLSGAHRIPRSTPTTECVSRRSGRAQTLPRFALPGDLHYIVAKALKESPLDRYGDVSAFADDLTRYLDKKPISARPSSNGYRLGKFVQRHPLGVAVTFVAIVGGAVRSAWQAKEGRRARARARF